jgi:hypothetical protein
MIDMTHIYNYQIFNCKQNKHPIGLHQCIQIEIQTNNTQIR